MARRIALIDAASREVVCATPQADAVLSLLRTAQPASRTSAPSGAPKERCAEAIRPCYDETSVGVWTLGSGADSRPTTKGAAMEARVEEARSHRRQPHGGHAPAVDEVARRRKNGPCEFALLIPDVADRKRADWPLDNALPLLQRGRRPSGGHRRWRRSLHVPGRRGARPALRRDHRLDAAQEDVQMAATRPCPKGRGPRALRSRPSQPTQPGRGSPTERSSTPG
jgi:hypothetical protein